MWLLLTCNSTMVKFMFRGSQKKQPFLFNGPCNSVNILYSFCTVLTGGTTKATVSPEPSSRIIQITRYFYTPLAALFLLTSTAVVSTPSGLSMNYALCRLLLDRFNRSPSLSEIDSGFSLVVVKIIKVRKYRHCRLMILKIFINFWRFQLRAVIFSCKYKGSFIRITAKLR